jgi:Putative capsular polysaccharide synthesis protein
VSPEQRPTGTSRTSRWRRAASHPLRSIATRNYDIARWYGLRQLAADQQRSHGPPVIVHQMGKVGSSSLAAAVAAALPNRVVHHVHHLTPERIARAEWTYREAFPIRRRIDRHVLSSVHLRRQLDAGELSCDAPVISLLRDPMSQRFSSFFQTLPFRDPDFPAKVRSMNLDELVADVVVQFRSEGYWHDDAIARFFEGDFRPTWSIDVFSAPFDRARGWQVYTGGGRSALVIRFEDLPTSGVRAARSYLGVPTLDLPRRQVSSEKEYGPVLQAVQDRIGLDTDYVKAAYSSDAVRHFYTDDEIGELAARWTGRR